MSTKPYIAIWPGRPGGYAPKIADELVAAAPTRAQSAKAMAKGHQAQAQAAKAKRKATRDNTEAFKPKPKGKKPATAEA